MPIYRINYRRAVEIEAESEEQASILFENMDDQVLHEKSEYVEEMGEPERVGCNYYRVWDGQRSQYFATGYNAESMQELIYAFQLYILGASEIDFEHEEGTPEYDQEVKDFLGTWDLIADYLQGVDLEEQDHPFPACDNW